MLMMSAQQGLALNLVLVSILTAPVGKMACYVTLTAMLAPLPGAIQALVQGITGALWVSVRLHLLAPLPGALCNF